MWAFGLMTLGLRGKVWKSGRSLRILISFEFIYLPINVAVSGLRGSTWGFRPCP